MLVFNKRYPYPPDCVYIGRGSPWGNPFRVPRGGRPGSTLQEYLGWALGRLRENPHWLDPLKHRNLLCFCAPSKGLGTDGPAVCHGQILLRLLLLFSLRRLESCPEWPLLGCYGSGSSGWQNMLSAKAEVFGERVGEPPTHIHFYKESLVEVVGMLAAVELPSSIKTYSLMTD